MRGKLAAPVALVAAVAAFTGIFLISGSLLWSPIVAIVAALGLYLMIDDRSHVEVADDTYAEDAQRKTDEVLKLVKEIGRLAKDVRSPSARGSLESACRLVPELLNRVKANSPNGLFSSASQLGAHLSSLHGVLTQYLEIQRAPDFYKNPAALQASGELAFLRFSEFAFDSVQLVGQGEIAQYRANLETVAPPKLPQLDKE
jgi:hypothetical protein